jgi:arylsulfatase
VPFIFSMSGETVDVGLDTCSPVGPYPAPYAFTGRIAQIEIELLSELSDSDAEAVRAGELRGAISQH